MSAAITNGSTPGVGDRMAVLQLATGRDDLERTAVLLALHYEEAAAELADTERWPTESIEAMFTDEDLRALVYKIRWVARSNGVLTQVDEIDFPEAQDFEAVVPPTGERGVLCTLFKADRLPSIADPAEAMRAVLPCLYSSRPGSLGIASKISPSCRPYTCAISHSASHL
jgi:hypothetical protein